MPPKPAHLHLVPQPAPRAQALWYVAPGRAELRPVVLPPPGRDEVVVRTLHSALSRGTERLVFAGRLPPGEWPRMRAPAQEGEFPFPVKYGYAAVGVVEQGPAALRGRAVFALHPHQERFVLPAAAVVPLPPGVPPRRGVLAANLETALNAIWDSAVAPADRVLVIGAGVVGCLVAALAARLPGAAVTLVDVAPERAAVAERLGAAFALPAAAPPGADVVFHCSASAEGLALALGAAGTEATIVEMSWYGDQPVSLPLGGDFHSRRLKLVSSQVGEVAPSHRTRWSRRRRLEAALGLLADPRFDALPLEEVAFGEAAAALPRLLAPGAPGLGAVLCYAD
ncbi:MAG TPA: zinc-binding alcohol dehydrogenase [Hyphomicrobiales bacterium]|nr:zinc-binding alcohol dehydrogenase [Hyphomicrobiales bacterium]